jgi:hypothetical protein
MILTTLINKYLPVKRIKFFIVFLFCSKMALANGIKIIWLDEYIGQAGTCQELKRLFQNTLRPAAEVIFDATDVLIWILEQEASLFLFVDTPDRAITLIEANNDKRIMFISSGSLGRRIIPYIAETYPHVHSF